MKGEFVYNGMLSVALVLLLPSLSPANDQLGKVGLSSVADISFEATAPYYNPHLAIVPAGMPVRWSNPTASPHSIRHDGCLTEEPCAFHSIAVPPDNSFVIAPLPPGRYDYHCELHPVMRGTLIVIEDPAAQDGAVSGVKPAK